MKKQHFVVGGTVIQLCYIFLPLILGGIHLFSKRGSSRKEKAKIFLLYYLFISVGIQGILNSIFQILIPHEVAAYVGWNYCPFLLEVGMANLAFGILGIASAWVKGTWRAATAVGYGLFLLFAAIGHLINAFTTQNYNIGNVGPVLWSDILVPLALLICLCFTASSKNNSQLSG